VICQDSGFRIQHSGACFQGLAFFLGWCSLGRSRELGWPREIDDPRARILIYQPQVDSFLQNHLKSRAAISVTTPDAEQPVFGAIWMKSRVSTDRDNRTVTILETKVPRVRFPDATDEQQEALAAILVENISNQEITFSLDRVLTMLDLAEHQRQAVDGFDTTPPKIKFVDYPAILVTIDGEPQLVDVESQASMKRVVNSAFMIILAGRNYLYARQDKWYVSAQVLGLGKSPSTSRLRSRGSPLAKRKRRHASAPKPLRPPQKTPARSPSSGQPCWQHHPPLSWPPSRRSSS